MNMSFVEYMENCGISTSDNVTRFSPPLI